MRNEGKIVRQLEKSKLTLFFRQNSLDSEHCCHFSNFNVFYFILAPFNVLLPYPSCKQHFTFTLPILPFICLFYIYEKDLLQREVLMFSKAVLTHVSTPICQVSLLLFYLLLTSSCLWLAHFNHFCSLSPFSPIIVIRQPFTSCACVFQEKGSEHVKIVETSSWNWMLLHRCSPPITMAIIPCKPYKDLLWGITLFC